MNKLTKTCELEIVVRRLCVNQRRGSHFTFLVHTEINEDTNLSPWSTFEPCTKECDYGLSTRTRVCQGDCCGYGALTESNLCNTDSCPGIFCIPILKFRTIRDRIFSHPL